MTPKTAYLRLIALAAFNDLDLIREELTGDLSAFDVAADVEYEPLKYSCVPLSQFGVPIFPSHLPLAIARIAATAGQNNIPINWPPKLAALLK